MNRRTLLLFALIGLAAIIAGAMLARMLGDNSLALESGTMLPQPRALERFALTDLAGRSYGPEQLHGHPTLLFFGFTNCPDVCPTTLATLAEVMRAQALPQAQVVFVSIDPQRDSVANLQVYLGAFDHDFIGLRGDEAALQPLLHSLGAIAIRQSLPGGGYTMDHSATLYLLDQQGRLRAVFSPPFSAPKLSADLHRIASAQTL